MLEPLAVFLSWTLSQEPPLGGHWDLYFERRLYTNLILKVLNVTQNWNVSPNSLCTKRIRLGYPDGILSHVVMRTSEYDLAELIAAHSYLWRCPCKYTSARWNPVYTGHPTRVGSLQKCMWLLSTTFTKKLDPTEENRSLLILVFSPPFTV